MNSFSLFLESESDAWALVDAVIANHNDEMPLKVLADAAEETDNPFLRLLGRYLAVARDGLEIPGLDREIWSKVESMSPGFDVIRGGPDTMFFAVKCPTDRPATHVFSIAVNVTLGKFPSWAPITYKPRHSPGNGWRPDDSLEATIGEWKPIRIADIPVESVRAAFAWYVIRGSKYGPKS